MSSGSIIRARMRPPCPGEPAGPRAGRPGMAWRAVLLLAVLLPAAAAQAAALVIRDDPGGPRLHYSYQGHYVEAEYTYAAACSQERFQAHCTALMDEYAREFEREVIKVLNEAGRRGGTEDLAAGESRQNGALYLIVHEDRELFSAVTLIEQSMLGRYAASAVEAVNIDLRNGRPLSFAALFGNPERAAMRCARAIEERFAETGGIAAQVLVAATEYEPRNFQITDEGLLFYLPGDLDPGSGQSSVSLEVPLSRLLIACPAQRFWPGRQLPCTVPQMKDGPGAGPDDASADAEAGTDGGLITTPGRHCRGGTRAKRSSGGERSCLICGRRPGGRAVTAAAGRVRTQPAAPSVRRAGRQEEGRGSFLPCSVPETPLNRVTPCCPSARPC